jgi:glutamate synthase domain-containing protein 3
MFDAEDVATLQRLIEKHVQYTGSPLGRRMLENWTDSLRAFVKVFPHEYKRVLQASKTSHVMRMAPAVLHLPSPAAITAGGAA